MVQRVAEFMMRSSRFGPKIIFRVDLHGVSTYGPKDQRSVIRWEWVESIEVEGNGVAVRSASEHIVLPSGAFGFQSQPLCERLQAARSITRRPEVIGELAAR